MVLEKWSFSDKTLETKIIPFHIPLVTGSELNHVSKAIKNKNLAAEGYFSSKCASFLEEFTACKKAIMTTSCTDALEMAAILADIRQGDEVIMASFNFVSAANAFVLRGAKICFIDVEPLHMNMDASRIEAAITPKTKVIVAMHYGGVACDMDRIMKIAKKYNLLVIEDAAHCIGSYFKGQHLGSIGHLGTLSFHETKNIQCGEGGALLINDEKYIHRAQILRDKGTDRSDFKKGVVKKYTWVDVGSSFGLGELHAAFLYGQFSLIKDVNEYRIKLWKLYYSLFSEHPAINISNECGNGHIFYVKFNTEEKREKMVKHLLSCNISSVSHYEPLHQSIAGKMYGYFSGEDSFTTIGSKTILRLPLHNELIVNDVLYVFQCLMKEYEM
jgi:dTDP-4-amino-4,6-dideoxygalactose transaminase